MRPVGELRAGSGQMRRRIDTVGEFSFGYVSSLNSVGQNAEVLCLRNSPTVSACRKDTYYYHQFRNARTLASRRLTIAEFGLAFCKARNSRSASSINPACA